MWNTYPVFIPPQYVFLTETTLFGYTGKASLTLLEMTPSNCTLPIRKASKKWKKKQKKKYQKKKKNSKKKKTKEARKKLKKTKAHS